MQATRSAAGATTGHHRPAALHAGLTSLARGAEPIANEVLIADLRKLAEAEHLRTKFSPQQGLSVAAYAPLNAFFAISANSPSMSMVNFSCCVCSAPASCASGVTRGMTAQPICAAGQTEAGAHAQL